MASTRVLWASLAAGATAMTALLAAAHAVSPYLQSDPPPLANVTRVSDAVVAVTKVFDSKISATQASVVKGQILGMWARLCDAERAKNISLAESYDAQLSDLQLDYMMLTGLTYPLRQCL